MAESENRGPDHGPVRIRLGRTPYLTSIAGGRHEFLADEPGDLGGGDEGPDPYTLLLGALGSCKAITASMYARRKGWDLTGVSVDLTHTRAEGHERIDVRLEFEGDLTDEQRRRLREIAGKCPVERTITGELRVVVGGGDAG